MGSIIVHFSPGDLIAYHGRYWRVTGNFLGGVNEANAVSLQSENYGISPATAHGKIILEFMIPEELLVAAVTANTAFHYKLRDYAKELKKNDTSRN